MQVPICCLLTQPYSIAASGRRDDGLNFLIQVRGQYQRPLAVSDPSSKTAGETAKKCIHAGVSLQDTMRLVPPSRTLYALSEHLKEVSHGR
jgi:hypothetical protein